MCPFLCCVCVHFARIGIVSDSENVLNGNAMSASSRLSALNLVAELLRKVNVSNYTSIKHMSVCRSLFVSSANSRSHNRNGRKSPSSNQSLSFHLFCLSTLCLCSTRFFIFFFRFVHNFVLFCLPRLAPTRTPHFILWSASQPPHSPPQPPPPRSQSTLARCLHSWINCCALDATSFVAFVARAKTDRSGDPTRCFRRDKRTHLSRLHSFGVSAKKSPPQRSQP